MIPHDIETFLWLFLAILAVWVVVRARRRARALDTEYRRATESINRRLERRAARGSRQPTAPDKMAVDREAAMAEDRVTGQQMRRARRQFFLTLIALVLVIVLAVTSYVQGGL